MGLFGRSKSLVERYPPERWHSIVTLLPLQAGILEAKHTGRRGELFNTRFFAGYLAGFPTILDEEPHVGAAIRKGMFDALFGAENGAETFRRLAAHLTLNDSQCTRGAGFGQADGQRFFAAVEANKPDIFDIKSFSSLDTALSAGFVDFDQTT